MIKDRFQCPNLDQRGDGQCQNLQDGNCTTCSGIVTTDRARLGVDYWEAVLAYLNFCDESKNVQNASDRTEKERKKAQKFYQRRLDRTLEELESLSQRLGIDNSSAPFILVLKDKELRRSIRNAIPEWRDQNEVCSITEIIEYTK